MWRWDLDEASRTVDPALAWCVLPEGQTVCGEIGHTHVITHDTRLSDIIPALIDKSGAWISSDHLTPARARTVGWHRHSCYDALLFDESQDWETLLADIQESLLWNTQHLLYARIDAGGPSWMIRDPALPPEQQARDQAYRDAIWEQRGGRHAITTHIPDVAGIQILTDTHLAQAHDLTHWTITPLGHHRNLVKANDLAPWYDLSHAIRDRGAIYIPINPDIWHQARQDFGRLIWTPPT